MIQPAHFRYDYPIYEMSCGPHGKGEEYQGMMNPNCGASGAFLQYVGQAETF